MRYKAICTDIDGTLLDANRQLSEETLAAFRKLKDIPVILASSRMPAAMTHLQEELGVLHHPLVCYNGGYVIRYEHGKKKPEVLESVVIPVDICSAIIDLAKGSSIHTSLYHEDAWHAPAFDHWTEREARITKVNASISDLADIIRLWRDNGWGGHKVMCMGPENEIAVMQQQLQTTFGNNIHIYRSRPTYLELAPRSISKATGLKLILDRYYALSLKDVIAFGDNYNDIELLEQAGWGVAVANAREEVKAIANEMTLDTKQHGVAAIIRKYFQV